jgi:transposase-like protein
MTLIRNAFRRLHYPVDIIAQCVRWYLAYSLSPRNLEEMMAKQGIHVDHSTLHRCVIRMVPLLDKVFRLYKRRPGRRWRMDEMYIRVKGQWKYLYRAVDSDGQTIDFLLTAKRDAAAALAELNAGREKDDCIKVRQGKYLNNLVEQDHRNIKRRIKLMAGFKSFRRVQTILAGIEIIHMLRKEQLQHPHEDGLSPAEQFYLLVAQKITTSGF